MDFHFAHCIVYVTRELHDIMNDITAIPCAEGTGRCVYSACLCIQVTDNSNLMSYYYMYLTGDSRKHIV